MPLMTYHEELTCAREAAMAAGALQLSMRQSLGHVEMKSDASPVTDVDRRCESAIREALLKRFPRDGFMGEESGQSAGVSGRMWIVDPIDGTRPYLRGIPTYSSLIALADGDRIVAGVMHFPALAETYWASENDGAFVNGSAIRVSRTARVGSAMGSAMGFLERGATAEGRRLFEFMRTWDYAYGYMDAYSYACVAAGRLDLCISLLDKPWDCAAAACIVREAGGGFSDLWGMPSIAGGCVVASNGLLHEAIITYFRST